jgi:hypothetical protein
MKPYLKVTRESVIQTYHQCGTLLLGVCGKDTTCVDASESAAKAIQQLYPQHIPLTVEDSVITNKPINCLLN